MLGAAARRGLWRATMLVCHRSDMAAAPLANAGHDTRALQAWLGTRTFFFTV